MVRRNYSQLLYSRRIEIRSMAKTEQTMNVRLIESVYAFHYLNKKYYVMRAPNMRIKRMYCWQMQISIFFFLSYKSVTDL